MNIESLLKHSDRQKLEQYKVNNKKSQKMSQNELRDLMGVNRDTYKRCRGAIRRK